MQSVTCSLQSAVCSLRSAVCGLQSAVCKCQTPGQYPFQPIKFMNLVVPSPCQTEPYNKYYISAGQTSLLQVQCEFYIGRVLCCILH